METKSLFDDKTLRVIIETSSGLAFAFVVGSLAAARRSTGGSIYLQWHWSILIVAAVTFVWNSRLWKAIWQVQHEPTAKAKRRLAFHLGVLIVLGLGSFLYPLFFVQAGSRYEPIEGLLTAATFLGILGFLIHKLVKTFEKEDAIELEREARESKVRSKEEPQFKK